MPLRVFMVTGTPYGSAAATAAVRISPSSVDFHGNAAPAALAGDLRHRAAEVEVDVADAVLGAQDLDRLADVDRVDAVQLHRPHRSFSAKVSICRLVRSPSTSPRDVIISHTYRPGTLLGAQLPERDVRDAGHRREHDRHGDLEVPAVEVCVGVRQCIRQSLPARRPV